MKKNRTSYDTGLLAETLAALYLRLKGYRVLAQRFKTPVGEIDLVVRRGRTLVFVEVKARGSVEAALESIKARQAQRIVRAAQIYLAGQGMDFENMRFDVIAIQPPWTIRHIRAAFTA
jgi:putative endonuclease